jgi:hypothetical protein
MTGSSCLEVAAFSALVSCAMTIALPYGKCVADLRGELGSGLAAEAIMVTPGTQAKCQKGSDIFRWFMVRAVEDRPVPRCRILASGAGRLCDSASHAWRGRRARHDDAAGVVATRGELWLTYFEPATLGEELRAIGLKQAKTSAPMSCTRVGHWRIRPRACALLRHLWAQVIHRPESSPSAGNAPGARRSSCVMRVVRMCRSGARCPWPGRRSRSALREFVPRVAVGRRSGFVNPPTLRSPAARQSGSMFGPRRT